MLWPKLACVEILHLPVLQEFLARSADEPAVNSFASFYAKDELRY
jgi:hypothetical protein